MTISNNLDPSNFFDTIRVGGKTELNHIYDTILQHDWETTNRLFRVPEHLQYRPDIIASRVYDEEGFWWILLLANGVTDPFEGFDMGEEIIVPTPSELFSVLRSKRR